MITVLIHQLHSVDQSFRTYFHPDSLLHRDESTNQFHLESQQFWILVDCCFS
uniref:Uncharacterized protein n=1 Tax=Anguilla anguilla TaxID=7936 RepID=A0A0E9WVW2_ANGAN